MEAYPKKKLILYAPTWKGSRYSSPDTSLDAYEMMPWIRTFFGRIKAIRCDNEDVKNQIKIDMVKMLKQYEDEHAFS